MTEKDRAEFNEWVSKMEHHDINWKPMWDFPTVAEDKKIKDRPLVVNYPHTKGCGLANLM